MMEFLCKMMLIIGPRGLILALEMIRCVSPTSILLVATLGAHCEDASALSEVLLFTEHVLLQKDFS